MDRNLGIDYYKSRIHVALRKESVDRNLVVGLLRTFASVALRKESVDRNGEPMLNFCLLNCRSPQGERG